ncbi:hypothetical protein BH11ARM2_BH11ARM2_25170 [soil metagenome]
MSRQSSEGPVNPEAVLISAKGATYALLEPLGEPGGSGTAFLALCTSGKMRGIPFAVKFFLSGNEARRRSFLEEIAFLQNETHPAILAVYDSGTTYNRVPFYISRHMSATLEDVIVQGEAPLLDKLLFASQLCAALAFLSSTEPKIVHRDVKPKNIFVNGRTCVLGDFGMMHRTGDTEVDPGMPKAYRTPELVRHLAGGGPVTPASDLYQLGLVLYRLFTGINPLLPCIDRSDPIILAPLPEVETVFGPILNNVLPATLAEDPERRTRLDVLQEIFIRLAEREGRQRALSERRFESAS